MDVLGRQLIAHGTAVTYVDIERGLLEKMKSEGPDD
jgi:hypothetical protein